MSRRQKITAREIIPDARYGDKQVSRFINYLLRQGKKSTAETIFYDAMDIITDKTKKPGIEVFRKAIKNVSPMMEVKSKRIGGATYQVPVDVDADRKFALATRWIIGYSKSKKGKPMSLKLAEELMAASNNEGASIKKKDDTHRMAEANKAFAHFR